jgi:methylated-DNA-[protein]-cysteine S-methyltransferase
MKTIDTPLGRVVIDATARGLSRVVLPGEKSDHASRGETRPPGSCPAFASAEAHLVRAEREIREYLAGRRRAFTVPVDLSGLPPFHEKVLRALCRVPYGRTVTYGQLAARVARPRAARAVGQVMARNPVPLVVPCHRVVATGGGLGGFGGGLDLKRRLLAIEGAAIVRRGQEP